ncbi:hypothetical protein CCACVL1_20588 [Corchorus capsularis]|uniref:Uncharacterized protein n=1 Tax=Corchorus capsularis TaxID=210143 RepID=A0A1R3HAT7_COCAP|nr:hypothetical protein CCACVL1_20588 [Corchorus capsularis]
MAMENVKRVARWEQEKKKGRAIRPRIVTRIPRKFLRWIGQSTKYKPN